MVHYVGPLGDMFIEACVPPIRLGWPRLPLGSSGQSSFWPQCSLLLCNTMLTALIAYNQSSDVAGSTVTKWWAEALGREYSDFLQLVTEAHLQVLRTAFDPLFGLRFLLLLSYF